MSVSCPVSEIMKIFSILFELSYTNIPNNKPVTAVNNSPAT